MTDQQINDLISRHEVHEYHPGAILAFARELLAMASAPSLTVGDVEMAALTEVAEFLNGEKPLEGVWFGDRHPEKRGSFWWRTNLREAVQALAAQLRAALAPAAQAEPVAWQPIETAPKDMRPLLLLLPAVGAWRAGAWRGSWSAVAECWTVHTPLADKDGKAVILTGIPDPIGWMLLPEGSASNPPAQDKEG